MDRAVLAEAFNEWMRRYQEDPEQFEREIVTVDHYRAALGEAGVPSYGDRCAGYLLSLIAEAQ